MCVGKPCCLVESSVFPLIVVETKQGERGGFFPLSLSFPVFSDNDMIQYDIMRYCYCTLSYLLSYSILYVSVLFDKCSACSYLDRYRECRVCNAAR